MYYNEHKPPCAEKPVHFQSWWIMYVMIWAIVQRHALRLSCLENALLEFFEYVDGDGVNRLYLIYGDSGGWGPFCGPNPQWALDENREMSRLRITVEWMFNLG